MAKGTNSKVENDSDMYSYENLLCTLEKTEKMYIREHLKCKRLDEEIITREQAIADLESKVDSSNVSVTNLTAEVERLTQAVDYGKDDCYDIACEKQDVEEELKKLKANFELLQVKNSELEAEHLKLKEAHAILLSVPAPVSNPTEVATCLKCASLSNATNVCDAEYQSYGQYGNG